MLNLKNRSDMVDAAEKLKDCLVRGLYEDAYNWTVSISHCLHGDALRKLSRVQDLMKQVNGEATQ